MSTLDEYGLRFDIEENFLAIEIITDGVEVWVETGR